MNQPDCGIVIPTLGTRLDYLMECIQSIRNAGYTERIISFEPMSVEYTQLLGQSSQDSKWDVAPRMAIGNIDGEVDINIAGNSGSSSILAMLDLHRQAAPESAMKIQLN